MLKDLKQMIYNLKIKYVLPYTTIIGLPILLRDFTFKDGFENADKLKNIIIDKINILKSAHQAMTNAVKKLKQKPKFIIIDGNRFYTDITTPYKCIIKGDTKYLSIASSKSSINFGPYTF